MRRSALPCTTVLWLLLGACQPAPVPERAPLDAPDAAAPVLPGATWGEKLGFPRDARVLILHADDIGMCFEANAAVKPYLLEDRIQSASAMVPCPWFDEFAAWYREHPDEDVGLHLTLTSEWEHYRWGPVANRRDVPGLVDPQGYLWSRETAVLEHASPAEVERELRAQIERALALGIYPSHLDTHMGALYESSELVGLYMRLAMEYGIPAAVLEMSPWVVNGFRARRGQEFTEALIALSRAYTLPKLDHLYTVPEADTYEGKVAAFKELVRGLWPGISTIIFHPSIETPALKAITGDVEFTAWPQRVWEARMFSDPDVIAFLEEEGVLFTNWKDMLSRFQERVSVSEQRK